MNVVAAGITTFVPLGVLDALTKFTSMTPMEGQEGVESTTAVIEDLAKWSPTGTRPWARSMVEWYHQGGSAVWPVRSQTELVTASGLAV